MLFPTILTALARVARHRRSRKSAPRRPARRLLCLEGLEDRCVPAVFNVIGTADGLGAVTQTGPGVFSAPSLRSAIQAANATPGGNTINLTVAGTYKITRAPTTANEADNAAGAFAILPTGGDLTVQNTSGGAVTVDGGGLSRVFDINPADSTDPAARFLVTFQGFTIQDGVAFDPNSPDGPTSSGGGIRDQGVASLTLNNVIVTNNAASADGGGISMENTVSAPWALTVTNSVVSDNHAGDAGGGLETDGLGTVLVTGTTITGNTCVNQGAGIWLDAVQNGNAFESATLTVTGTVVSGNQALAARNGNLFNDGGGIGSAGDDTNFAGTVTGVNIINSTVENNSSAGVGGGFGDQDNQDTLNVQNSLFLNNTSGNGGGGISFSGTRVTVNNTALQGNGTGGSGGALFVGGPVTSSGTPTGTAASVLTLTNSTLAGNTATGNGGGIELETTGTGSTITNATIAGNRALNNGGGQDGGGIDAPAAFTGRVALSSDTINANFANTGGGIFWASTTGSGFSLQNTIVALDTPSNGVDIFSAASVTDSGGNLIASIASGGFLRTSGLDPLLGPLQDNGGQLAGAPGTQEVVPTEALLAGSTAVGAGVPGAPPTDERGFPRVNGRIDSGAFEVQALTSALTLTASPGPALFGQPVTFTATVSSQTPGTNAVPTGTVTFFDGATPLGTGTLRLVAGQDEATFTTAALAVGGHQITAAYGGDSTFTAGTSAPPLREVVNRDGTSTTLTASAPAAVLGQQIAFTATVAAAAPGSGNPTGTVTFYDGTTALGTGTLRLVGGQEQATLSTSALGLGGHSIKAVYGGDGNFTGSTSAALSQRVLRASATQLRAAVTSPVFGQPVMLMATVGAVTIGPGGPTGTVRFYDGTHVLGTAPVRGGVALFTATGLAVGSHTLTAVYSGDAAFLGSTSAALTETVRQAMTATSLVTSGPVVVFGRAVNLTAAVRTVPPGAGTPTGTVTFYDGTQALGTVTLVDGQAVLSGLQLARGRHTITAVYSGDGDFLTSTSQALFEVVV